MAEIDMFLKEFFLDSEVIRELDNGIHSFE